MKMTTFTITNAQNEVVGTIEKWKQVYRAFNLNGELIAVSNTLEVCKKRFVVRYLTMRG
jgi:hypothetical protein